VRRAEHGDGRLARVGPTPPSEALAGRHVLRWRLPENRERAPAGPGTRRVFARLAVGSAREALGLADELALDILWLVPPLAGVESSWNLAQRESDGWRTRRIELTALPTDGPSTPVSRVVLAGFMGAGKTTLGRALAGRLGWTFADTDQLVEDEARCPLTAVFAREGEAGFRARERRAVARALLGERTVVALGGGALDDPWTRRRVAAAGLAVLLWAPLPMLLARAADGARPLLDGRLDPADLLERRRRAYLTAADLVLSTGEGSPADLAARLEDELRAGGGLA